MKDVAIELAIKPNAQTFKNGESYSNGNIVIGIAGDNLAIAFNGTEHNRNQVCVLERNDACAIFALMTSALRNHGWLI